MAPASEPRTPLPLFAAVVDTPNGWQVQSTAFRAPDGTPFLVLHEKNGDRSATLALREADFRGLLDFLGLDGAVMLPFEQEIGED